MASSFVSATQSLEVGIIFLVQKFHIYYIYSFSKFYFSTYYVSAAMLVVVGLEINMGNVQASRSFMGVEIQKNNEKSAMLCATIEVEMVVVVDFRKLIQANI